MTNIASSEKNIYDNITNISCNNKDSQTVNDARIEIGE